ncbi:MAG: hypothetical protein WC784_05275 [Candidatus Shapirobacteria bacterium]|jgi:hypothetical protein
MNAQPNSEPISINPKITETTKEPTLSEKIAYIQRSPQQQLNDVLSQGLAILATPDENLSDEADSTEALIKKWRNDSTLIDKNALNYFDHNFSVLRNYERPKIDTATATAAEIDSQFNQSLERDRANALHEAMAILAVQKFIQQGDFEAALIIMNNQEDIIHLPKIVKPIVNWIDTQSQENPNFITEFIPKLIRNERSRGRNILQAFSKPESYAYPGAELWQAPSGTESFHELSNIGREINNYQEQKSKGNELRVHERNYHLENQIDKDIGYIIFSLEKSQKQNFNVIWNQNFQLPVEALRSLKKLSNLCQSEWFVGLSSTNPDIQTRISDILIAATLVELQSTETDINNNHISEGNRVKSLEIIGNAIATIKHSGVPEQISNALDSSLKTFTESRPDLANELIGPINNANQQFEDQTITNKTAAQEAIAKQKILEAENEQALAAAAKAEINNKMISYAFAFKQLPIRDIFDISQEKSTKYNSPEAIKIAHEILEQVKQQTQIALEKHQTKKGTILGVGGSIVIDSGYLEQLQKQEDTLNLALAQNPNQNGEELLADHIKSASLHHTISWAKSYKAKG